MKILQLSIVWLLLWTTGAVARPDESRLKLLARGVNLSHWFAQNTNDYKLDDLNSFISEDDMRRIRTVGFYHVRLGVDPSIVDQPRPRTLLNEKIKKLIAAGLAVIVDFHPSQASKETYQTDAGRTELIRLWVILAAELRRFDPAKLFIEVMNEPFPLDGREWQSLQSELVRVIRAKAPNHTILVNAGGWSGIDELSFMTALDDSNIVYTAHWYGPLLFTHQGADWTWEMVRRVKPVTWPIDSKDATWQAHAIANDPDAENILRNEIAGGQFAEQNLERKLDQLVAWQNKNAGAAVYVGEFGVYGLQSPRPSAVSWVSAARRAFEVRDIGWSYWDYSSSFCLLGKESGPRTFNADMLSALGIGTK